MSAGMFDRSSSGYAGGLMRGDCDRKKATDAVCACGLGAFRIMSIVAAAYTGTRLDSRLATVLETKLLMPSMADAWRDSEHVPANRVEPAQTARHILLMIVYVFMR